MAEKIDRPTRDALRILSPGPVALVTSMYRDQPNVMAAAWMQPLSLSPTLVALAVQPSRLTHEFITKTEVFTLNIPTAELLTAVHQCGMVSGREKDKFELCGLTPEEGSETEAPLIAECVAHVACAVQDRITLGDHDLFVGHVLQVLADSEAFDGTWQVEVDAGRVLHHLGGDHYAALGKVYRARLPEEGEE